ncbi:asparaginyl-tRNA synthetase [Acrodontium crateriforme]|uniref:asparagine--tRNA ligase n=1 Tax=Acrodontium crateriforme TaxID=150365 RepID=A0AAQ3R7C3_9PEZI|nr:asparaginyl-tRNA synthetase [Acrodontium crateriforme]
MSRCDRKACDTLRLIAQRAASCQRRSFASSRAPLQRITVSDLLHQNAAAESVTVHGWVRSVRKQKRIAFAALGDGSSLESLQAVLKPEQVAELSTGTAVELKGSWKASVGSKQSHELQVASVRVLGDNDPEANPLQPKYQTLEYLRTIPHLRPRIPANALLLRLRSQIIASLTRFFSGEDFVQTHTPIITSSDCEGAGEVFTVSSNAQKDEKTTGKPQDDHFFRASKYLTVSSQLHLEALAQAVNKVWTLSPTFRAEKSDTPRHLSEFYMLEAEMCFVEDMNDVMDLVENMLRSVVTELQNSRLGHEILQVRRIAAAESNEEIDKSSSAETLQTRWTGMAASNWPRITYAEAISTLQQAQSDGRASFVFAPQESDGLQAEHERFLASTIGQGKPVFVTDYPAVQKPFYMPPSSTTLNSKGTSSTVACFDLLVPDLCELVGGSMREFRLNALVDSMQKKGVAGENLEWYQDLRKYGSVPHGGFGLGFDRLLCYLSGVGNVRDVVAFPRWHGRCEC